MEAGHRHRTALLGRVRTSTDDPERTSHRRVERWLKLGDGGLRAACRSRRRPCQNRPRGGNAMARARTVAAPASAMRSRICCQRSSGAAPDACWQAVEAEAEAFRAERQGLRLPDPRARMVRHGRGSMRPVATGIGPAAMCRATLRDRGAEEAARWRICCTWAPRPRWTWRLNVLLLIRQRRGLVTDDLGEAAGAQLGEDNQTYHRW